MKTSLLFSISGLIVEAFCLYELTPGTFVTFALVSVPAILVGIAIFSATVWRVLRQTREL